MTLRTILPRLTLGLALAGSALWLALHRDSVDPAQIEAAMSNLGAWAPLGFVLAFAIGTVLFVPGALFGLVGGALFGPVSGTLLSLCGATLGATVAFLAGRYLAADWVRGHAGPKLERLIAGVEAEGWRFVAFVRLVPLFPFNLSNYALGLTHISLKHYVLSTLICMTPGALAFTWLGYAGREAAAGNEGAIRYGLLALALLAGLAFLPQLISRLRGEETPRWIDAQDLAGRLKDTNGVTVIDVRRPDEFTGPLGHIAQAVNLPVGEMPQRLHELAGRRGALIVLVCHTDKHSAQAAALLRDAGRRDVAVLRGGMVQWNRSGLPVAHASQEKKR
jgi:uncharacterized membrane protein YdjX (TVP38/TMEM64 family)/rhodanese-related sulfurtransferase